MKMGDQVYALLEPYPMITNHLEDASHELTSHMRRVSDIAYRFGMWIEVGYRDLNNLTLGGFLHDIGKVEIPENVLFKEGKLTDKEYTLVKEHAVRGHQLLSDTGCFFPKDVMEIVLQHHERIDGKGYPYGLKGDDINPMAKIMSLCDVFDAITHVRSYKEAFKAEFAMNQIQIALGTQFDQQLGSEFLQFLQHNETLVDDLDRNLFTCEQDLERVK